MQKNLFVLFGILIFAIASCGDPGVADEKSVVINGTFYNAEDNYVILEELTISDRVPVDSVRVRPDGTFRFRIEPEQTGFYVLKIHENNFITLLAEKGETINITADARQIAATYDLEGSYGSELIRDINIKLRSNQALVDSLRDEFERSKYMDNFQEVREKLDSMYFEIVKDQKQFVTDFITQNTESLASLIALYQTFGQQPVLSEEEDFSYFEKLAEGLMKSYPDNPHSIDLYERVEDIRQYLAERARAAERMQVGNVAPDISLHSPQGETIELSSLRGKYVLVKFWASWCAPCRQKNPQFVDLYNRFRGRNFEIYAVSLDRDRQMWEAAIELDKLSWIQVSDLAYWHSPLVMLYNIESIPASYLIDPDGIILKKNPDIDELYEILRNVS